MDDFSKISKITIDSTSIKCLDIKRFKGIFHDVAVHNLLRLREIIKGKKSLIISCIESTLVKLSNYSVKHP